MIVSEKKIEGRKQEYEMNNSVEAKKSFFIFQSSKEQENK